MKYALIDMGSNSIRLTVYELDHANFRVLFKEKIMAGLAGYVEHGRLTQDGINCACQSLIYFRNMLTLLEIWNMAVFATASLRNISNTQQAIEQIWKISGIMVEVLTGEAEASFGFYGATCDIEIQDGLFADIGGASVELAFFEKMKLERAVSASVGSLKLYRDCVKKILPGKGSQKRIEKAIRQAFSEDTLQDIPQMDHMLCVGGTARACLRLCQKLMGLSENCCTIHRTHLEQLAKKLYKNDKESTDLILRYAPERIHTFIPGLMILVYLVNRYDVADITVSHYGVREGYLCQKIQPTLRERV